MNDAIRASGEDVEFFADLKVGLMQAELGALAPTTILDFGCGIGLSTAALARRFPASAITGCDESRDSIRLADGGPAAAMGARFAWLDGEILPFANASLDAVFAACVFHHIQPTRRSHWANELWRVLKPGGTLHIFEHNPFNPLTRRVVAKVSFDEGVVLLSRPTVQDLLISAGFTVVRQRYYFFFPRRLRWLRRFESALGWLPVGAQHYSCARRPGPP